MPSLAGRPPYATDEPDSAYARPDHRRPPPQPRHESTTSAYDVYDNYLDPRESHQPTNNSSSGVGAAFMTGGVDEESDSEDDHAKMRRQPMDPHHHQAPSMPLPAPAAGGKNAALAAAVRPRDDDFNPPPQYRAHPTQPPQAAIAAPRPGYAAPIEALNGQAGGRQVPPGIHVPHPNQRMPQATPSPTSPHPLQAPITPIQPAFARPRPPKNQDIKFTGDIMRGGKEESVLPRRGEKGDDFWRRFSMVVKDESTSREKTSSWLRTTESRYSRFSKWIWLTGLIILIAAAGGIGLGFYISNKSPDHYQPTAIGGSAEQSGAASSVATIGSGGATVKSSLFVSPTNTVARRAPEVTPAPLSRKRFMHNREH